MSVFESRFVVDSPVEAVRAFHSGTDVLRTLTPPPMIASIHEFGELDDGMVARFTLWLGPIPIRWHAVHRDVGPTGFTDEQLEGPMKHWVHRHEFMKVNEATTEVRDTITYQHPPGAKGVLTRLLFNPLALRGLFFFRALRTRQGLRRG